MNPEEKDIENPINQLIRNIHDCHGEKAIYDVLANLLGYEKTPPSIEEFVDGSNWLGSVLEEGLYPPWRMALYEIYPNPFYSKYAEICLSGDTKVDLLDGTSRTMIEICEEFSNKKFWVLSYDISDNSWKPSLAHSPRKTRSNCKVYRITLDNGKSFKATEDHPILTIDNKWKSIGILKIGDSLKSYNKLIVRNLSYKITLIEFAGYEDVYNFEVEKYHNFLLTCGVVSHNCLSGSIGSGKTSIGLVGALYDLTRMALLKQPQEHFKLLSTTKIAYTIINRTLTSARDILYDQIKDMVAASPILYEMHRKAYKERRSIKTLFPNNIDLLTASRAGHALGAAICGAILDELNFQDNAYKNYLAIKRRIQSRFLQPGGHYPSRVWMLSSKDKHTSFLEDHIRENITNPTTKVYEYAIWEIQKHKKSATGESLYCGKTFKVFCGDVTKDPRILKGKGDSIGLDASRIIDVPIEYYNDFKKDIYNSLRELAGKSTDSVFKYIPSVELIDKAMCLTNPVHKEEIILDFNNRSENIIDYVDTANLITPQYPYNHRHIHIDMALGKKDRLGIASTFIASVSNTFKRDNRTGLEIPMKEPFYITELILAIKAKSGSEIPLYKIKEFIATLINSYNYPLTKVSLDGFQSSSLRQDLNIMGINAEYLSVDRTKEPYEILKQAILGGKWLCVKSPILDKELKGLVDTGKKVDHTSDGCFVGETLIKLDDGTCVRIDDFEGMAGREAISLNRTTGKLESKAILSPRKTKEVTDLIEIELEDGSNFRCTLEHLILCSNGIYKAAKDLTVDDELMLIGYYRKIKRVIKLKLNKPESVYDIEVLDNNNFCLSNGVIAHNSKDLADGCAGSIAGCYYNYVKYPQVISDLSVLIS